jgi:hypothetical protein
VSSILTESDSYDATVVTPETGDTDYPATVKAGRQSLANRTNFVLKRLQGEGDTESLAETSATASEPALIVPADAIMGGGNLIKDLAQGLASRIKQIKNRAYGGNGSTWNYLVPPVPSFITGSEYELALSGSVVSLFQNDVSGPKIAYFNFAFPLLTPYATITRAFCYVQGISHGGTLPGSQPACTMSYHTNFGTTANQFATGLDAQATAAAYDTAHIFELTVTPLTLGPGVIQMSATFTGEYGVGAAGLRLQGFMLQLTPN